MKKIVIEKIYTNSENLGNVYVYFVGEKSAFECWRLSHA